MYVDQSRESDKYSLPDVEIWPDQVWIITCNRGCGEFEQSGQIVEAQSPDVYCPSCQYHSASGKKTEKVAWFYQYGFPGCMPDGDVTGPFETEENALENARDQAGL